MPKKETIMDIVLITGGSGFIGSALGKRLSKNYRVISLDHKPPAYKAMEFVEIDLASDEAVKKALDAVRKKVGNSIASVVHLAAYFDLSGEDNEKYEQITAQGTRRLLESLQGFEVEQFIFSSTMLVHQPSPPGSTINEDAPLDERFPYPASKIHTERLIHEKRGDIPVVFLRPAGVYDGFCHNAFLAHQIGRIYEKRLIAHFYPGDLTTGQSFLHLNDLTDAIARLIERRKELPDELPLLLGEEDVMGVEELQGKIGRELHGEDWQTWEIPKAMARSGVWMENEVIGLDRFIQPWMVDIADDHYALDISRARQLLGWVPKHSLRATLPVMLEKLKDEPAEWYVENKLPAHKVIAISAEDEVPPRHKSLQEHVEEMHQLHLSTLWAHLTCMMLGLWLALSPFIWDGFSQTEFPESVLLVTADRGLIDPAVRMQWLAWSDLISGVLIMLFSGLSLCQRFSWAQWANTAVGCWLLFAPLLFWSPSAAVYNNDTLIGTLVISLAILIPMMPGMSHEGMMDQSDIPPGWTYSPSTYSQRIPIIALGFIGFLIARYLTAYQLGHTSRVWDPFFGDGTARVITSDVSKAWPVADAGLGAVSYIFEVLMGIMGTSTRWRTMPWMVLGFGIVVVPLGAVSIFFIIIQPIVIGTWCSLCLLAAAAMVVMIPFTLDEVVASCQFLAGVCRRKLPFWRNFFQGGAMPGGTVEKAPTLVKHYFDISDLTRGVTWQLLASCLIGVMLMLSRLIFDTEPPMAHSDHLIGALIIVVAVSAMAEVGRALRYINIPLGLWLVIAPWLLTGAGSVASWMSVVLGIALIMLSLPLGRRSEAHYGSWDKYVL